MRVYDIHNLVKRYPNAPRAANDGISLQVEQGEFFGLLGDNGAGKSTLVRQMANLLRPTSGTITLYGQGLDSTPMYTPSRIGYMPQTGFALNNLTVAEAIYLTAHLRGLSRPDARAERERLIDLWQLGPVRHQVATQLSGGQRRLLLLATTLAATPPVVILDEPTNDLDPLRRTWVWDNVRALNRQKGTTIILVTHNVVEAEKVIDRVGILRDGRLVAQGRPSALKAAWSLRLRVDVVFAPGHVPALPVGARPSEVAPERWQFTIARSEALVYTRLLTEEAAVEDFRLSTATLEDLYLSLIDVPPDSTDAHPTLSHPIA